MAKVTITTLLALFFIATLNAQVRDSTRVIDTISIQKERFKIRKLYIPVALMGTGLAFNSNRPESF